MIADLKPYPEYKESGLPWLVRVPSTWRVVRNGSLFSQRNQTGHEALPILEVSLKTGVRVRDFENSARKQVMSDLAKYKRAAKNDVAYNMMRMWQGAVGVSPIDGLVSPAYVVARPYLQVEPRFFVALFRTGDYMAEIDSCSRGIVKDRNRLYWDHFKQILTPCPPPHEQAAIVRFLDWANGRLERAIKAKRKVIALLGEQKQAIIHRAVTRGLDPSLPLKPTGIAGLGNIPQDWEVRKVREVARVINGYPFDSKAFFLSGGYPLVRIRDLDRVDTAVRYRGAFVEAARVTSDDVLIGMDGDFNVGSWRGSEPALLNQRMCCVRARTPVLTQFLGFVLPRPLKGINALTYATTVKHLDSGQVERIQFAVPPEAEMAVIIEYARAQTQSFVGTISRFEREMELLREYRIRLVADVVTGKLDVREAAARLPDEASPDTAEDGSDDYEDDDGDGVDTLADVGAEAEA